MVLRCDVQWMDVKDNNVIFVLLRDICWTLHFGIDCQSLVYFLSEMPLDLLRSPGSHSVELLFCCVGRAHVAEPVLYLPRSIFPSFSLPLTFEYTFLQGFLVRHQDPKHLQNDIFVYVQFKWRNPQVGRNVAFEINCFHRYIKIQEFLRIRFCVTPAEESCPRWDFRPHTYKGGRVWMRCVGIHSLNVENEVRTICIARSKRRILQAQPL
mmetsp:Transcript_11449/g.29078  ORF Transcript_11449/g.29078 Transcript_11449/m.29078 type:complete len:210 (+) Transcript_11449:278-907(+)